MWDETVVMQMVSKTGTISVARVSEELIADMLDHAPWMSDIYFLATIETPEV